jgi:dTMP kinase
MFLSLDGIDGAGKSTQIELLADWLRGRGHNVLTCRDPGSTPLGEAVRGIVLGHHETPVGMRAEMLLYMAARAQLVEEIIRPALDAGKAVISDRFLLANVVYQGYGGGLNVEELWTVGRIATGGLAPQLTFLLDMPPEKSLQRLTGKPDRMEQRGAEFLTRVRNGFLTEAAKRPSEIAIIDASRTIEQIQEEIRDQLHQRILKVNR